MKRSSAVTLTIMSAVTMTACGDATPPAPTTYATAQECIAGGQPQDVCLKSFDDAVAAHTQSAPAFPSKEACESGVDVDRCVPAQRRNADGSMSSIFVPAMAGYILGNALGGRGYASAPVYRSRDTPTGYRDPGSLINSRTAARTPAITTPSRPPMVAPGPTRSPNVGTTTISRGGFGGSGSSFSGGGS